jgi:hypothetical protein
MARSLGGRPGRSILCVYVRTRTRPGDKTRRKKRPAGALFILKDYAYTTFLPFLSAINKKNQITRRLAMLKTLEVPGSEAPYPDLSNTDKETQVNLLVYLLPAGRGGKAKLGDYTFLV